MIFLQPIKKYTDFSGRATRSEFWLFLLFTSIIAFILGYIDASLGTYDPISGFGFLSGLFILATILPYTAVAIRRLHDTNKSGWMYLLVLIPVVNFYILVLMCFDSDEGENDYGPNVK